MFIIFDDCCSNSELATALKLEGLNSPDQHSTGMLKQMTSSLIFVLYCIHVMT